jgi:hypothetical protein
MYVPFDAVHRQQSLTQFEQRNLHKNLSATFLIEVYSPFLQLNDDVYLLQQREYTIQI